MSRDCTQNDGKSNSCFRCKEEGHKGIDCPKFPKLASSSACFKCGEEGHQSRECTKKPQRQQISKACFNCGEEGHIGRDCPQPRKTQPRTGPKVCNKC